MKNYTNGHIVSPGVYISKGIDAAVRLSAAANIMEATYDRLKKVARRKGYKETEKVYSDLWESWFTNSTVITPAIWNPWQMLEVLGL